MFIYQSWNSGVLYCSDTSCTALNCAISELEKVPLNCIKYIQHTVQSGKKWSGALDVIKLLQVLQVTTVTIVLES